MASQRRAFKKSAIVVLVLLVVALGVMVFGVAYMIIISTNPAKKVVSFSLSPITQDKAEMVALTSKDEINVDFSASDEIRVLVLNAAGYQKFSTRSGGYNLFAEETGKTGDLSAWGLSAGTYYIIASYSKSGTASGTFQYYLKSQVDQASSIATGCLIFAFVVMGISIVYLGAKGVRVQFVDNLGRPV